MARAKMLVLAAALLAGCDPTVWDGLRGDAPVVVVDGLGGGGTFGRVLVAYEGTLGDSRVSRYAVAGGSEAEDSPFFVFAGYDGLGGAPRARFDDPFLFAGCDEADCGDGYGAALAAFPEWLAPDATVRHACVAAPSRSGSIQVRCEDRQPGFQTVEAPPDEAFGASAAGISFPRHRAGAALIGAPSAASGAGALYRLPFDGTAPIAIDLGAAMLPPSAHVGAQVAVAPRSDRAVLFATRADLDGATDRVLVGTLDVDDAAVATVTLHACLEGPSGYGAALALGDLDGDDIPDVAIGTAVDAAEPRIDVLSGAALPQSSTCADAQPAPTTRLACDDVASDGVSCDAGPIGLGVSLAIADVDADGVGDLIAGAPLASPRGEAGAGAVLVLAGQEGALGMLGIQRRALYHSSLEAGHALGTAVAAVAGPRGAEIVAGAPGDPSVAVFLCSGLGDDVPDEDRSRGCL